MTVHVVVVVLTIVRHTEVGLVVLDGLLLTVVLRLIVHTDTVCLCSCVWDASWVGTIAGKVAKLSDDTLASDVDVLGVLATLACYKVGADTEGELGGVGHAPEELGVIIDNCRPRLGKA